MAEGRDESPIRLPALLLRMLRSPFRPPGLVSTQDGPATGPVAGHPGVRDPGVLGTQVARRTQLNGPDSQTPPSVMYLLH